jgi:hypothetical protein
MSISTCFLARENGCPSSDGQPVTATDDASGIASANAAPIATQR